MEFALYYSMINKVAIPVLGKDVAPCFAVASKFLIANIKDNKKISENISCCWGREGHCRIKFLKKSDVNILICNGIKLFYRDLLNALGVIVLPNVSGTANKALEMFLYDQLETGTAGSLNLP